MEPTSWQDELRWYFQHGNAFKVVQDVLWVCAHYVPDDEDAKEWLEGPRRVAIDRPAAAEFYVDPETVYRWRRSATGRGYQYPGEERWINIAQAVARKPRVFGPGEKSETYRRNLVFFYDCLNEVQSIFGSTSTARGGNMAGYDSIIWAIERRGSKDPILPWRFHLVELMGRRH